MTLLQTVLPLEEVSSHLIKSDTKFIYYTHSLSPRVRYVKEAPHAHRLASLPSCVLCSPGTEVETKVLTVVNCVARYHTMPPTFW